MGRSASLLVQGREKYIISEARPIHAFLGLSEAIESLSLAQYFCELAGVLAPREEPAPEQLRLICTALYHLEQGTRPLPLIKAVTELRLLSLGGFMPNLTACARCGNAAENGGWLLPREGRICCGECGGSAGAVPVSAGVLRAMQHIVSAPLEKCFGFSLSEEGLSGLKTASEAYLLCQMGRGFRTLDFYNSL